MPRPVKLVVDCEVLAAPRSGIGVYLEEVLAHLDPRLEVERRAMSPGVASGKGRRFLRYVPGAYTARRARIGWPPVPDDAVFFGSNYLLPPWPLVRGRAAITIQDLIFFEHPEWADKKRGAVLRKQLPDSARRAEAIIVTTERTKEEVSRRFNMPARVIGLGIRKLELPERSRDERPIVVIGNIEPRKDQLAVVHAHRTLPPELRQKHPLWIVGRPLDAAYGKQLATALDPPYSRFFDDMAVALAHAALCVQASRAEGYGLVPLEALAAGVPVLASDLAVTTELCGALADYFTAGDTHALSKALLLSLEHPRAPSAQQRAALLSRHDWAEVGQKHSELFLQLSR